MDRHHENWGITQDNVLKQLSLLKLTKEERLRLKKSRTFCKLFDHGSSLLFELGEDKVESYLKDRNLFDQIYISGKIYSLLLGINGEKLNVFEILRQNMKEGNWGKRIKRSIFKIVESDSLKVAQLILQMPTGGVLDYSYDRKRLLYYSLEKRKEILGEIIV